MALLEPLPAPAGRSSTQKGESLTAHFGAILARNERWLWAVAVLALLADVVTTLVGLQTGLAEGNPVVAGALADAGLLGFFGVKVGVLALAVGGRIAAPGFRVAIPLGIAVPWLAAAGTNALLLFAVA
ncbi:hypothetical protein L593_13005 [Salinarchaeum sp. Harcht-Bsk1]|uniref:DUF5658 family protein n=1 Tax=Salinarchaeum sp. Harcht-Bsk1 TaxID=1333523 RepID=UPI000342469B|nr:DUF5658 family protein [Salinarchaeum sp. Harcht-Bsk1]AGN02540.1 hypothetical protein L593_13005 [Salinarchaeum sp. Harcht-Bsk1]